MKDPCIQYCNQFMIQRTTAVEYTENQMRLKEHQIRNSRKIETKGNIKYPLKEHRVKDE